MSKLFEGLRPKDLKDMVKPIFEVDTYKSKMGEDRDVCVLSFCVKDRHPARDMMEFIEKGFHFVLDADVSAGENSNGEYYVFVEMSRTPRISEHINELVYGVSRLTGIDNWQFSYHKSADKHPVTRKSLQEHIPDSPVAYERLLVKKRTDEVKTFFSKTLMDDLTLDNNVITIHKPFNQKIQLKLIDEDVKEHVLENTTGDVSMDDMSMSEIFWLTKVLGDYDITKLGESFVFTNGNRAMVLQRM